VQRSRIYAYTPTFASISIDDLHLDRHRPGRRQQQPRDRRAALAEGRRLQLVARAVAVELEALRLGRLAQPVEMLVQIGEPVVGVEPHGLFEVVHPRLHCRLSDKGQAPIARLPGSSYTAPHEARSPDRGRPGADLRSRL